MNKELIQKRLQDIEVALKQSQANFNLLEGGKAECLYWISQIEQEEKQKVELKEVPQDAA